MSQAGEGLSIADVMDHYGVLDSTRRIVSCPLHEDRTPSCSLDHSRSLWRCHSCGEGGDIWTLIELKEGVGHRGAREFAETAFGFREEGTEQGSERVFGSAYGGGRRVSGRTGDKRDKRAYKPSWRR